MCYNAEISLNTFIYGTIALIITLILNKLPITEIIIVFTISLIQLMEYFAWTNINNSINLYYISHFGLFIIFIQVFLITYSHFKNEKKQIMLLLLFLTSIYIYYNTAINNKFNMEKGKNGHLIWWWLDIVYPLNILLLLIFYMYPYYETKSYITLILVIISVGISLYYNMKYKTWGSMWCYIGNLFWIALIIKSIYFYITEKNEINNL